MSLRPRTPKRTSAADHAILDLGGRKVAYRVMASQKAEKMRIRIGLDGMDVIRPIGRDGSEVAGFLEANHGWIIHQLDRIERMRRVRVPLRQDRLSILYRGERTTVSIESKPRRRSTNKVVLDGDKLLVVRGADSTTAPAQSLENWLRKQARQALNAHLAVVLPRLSADPGRIYVMDQRTKWGNCSALGNLSFSWRLIMAPPFVLEYLVTHEAVHLVVPDHSKRFWLTVQSLCSKTERARQWLAANGAELMVDLDRWFSK
jgi:predicted metal-dependent hydrolase